MTMSTKPNYLPVSQRQWDSLSDVEQAAYRMEARNAASVITQRNSRNSPDFLIALAREIEAQAQERLQADARKAGKAQDLHTQAGSNRNPDGTFRGGDFHGGEPVGNGPSGSLFDRNR
ncbi:MAG: hypothetical protein C0519_00550 [Hyphomicrobium sp.]|nr:hypothetical protein [Hyphomicrobium sp.]PPD08022.1 MAG: hypothetical protein CTY28_07010 [Hyphomicrobium sp.]